MGENQECEVVSDFEVATKGAETSIVNSAIDIIVPIENNNKKIGTLSTSGRIEIPVEYIEIIPEYLLNIPKLYGIHIDIMVEAKMKELSIQKLYKQYPHLNCINVSQTSSENDKDLQEIQKLSGKD